MDLNNDWDIKYLYTDDTDSGWIANTFTANKPEKVLLGKIKSLVTQKHQANL